MPLYEHASGERVRTVAESAEDQRLHDSTAWTLVDERKPADQPADKPAHRAAARGSVTATGGDDK